MSSNSPVQAHSHSGGRDPKERVEMHTYLSKFLFTSDLWYFSLAALLVFPYSACPEIILSNTFLENIFSHESNATFSRFYFLMGTVRDDSDFSSSTWYSAYWLHSFRNHFQWIPHLTVLNRPFTIWPWPISSISSVTTNFILFFLKILFIYF